MAFIYSEPSRTFGEYLLVPGYSSKECIPANVSLRTPLVKFRRGEEPAVSINTPMVSAIMQSVSNDTMAIALAQEGGISFIYGSQSVEDQAQMVRNVKGHKAGFVKSDSNLRPDATLKDVLELHDLTGHSTVAITADGTGTGKLVGLVTDKDYRISRMPLDMKVSEFMTPLSRLVYATEDITLKIANDIIWDHKINSLPIVDDRGHLKFFVFRKDYSNHKANPLESIDSSKRYLVGAGINTRYLAECGADFVKVGIGGGSICITREQKGIGRGQATAMLDVARARDEYYEETGIYVPICSDGGIVHDYHITLALAMGADFVMLGRYFSRFDESPTPKIRINGNYYKEYWGEGSNRARNWQRYDMGGAAKLSFEEGVDAYVPYAGSLKDNLAVTLGKVRSTMCNCGVLNLADLRKNAKLTLVSSTSIVEGGSHDVILKSNVPVSGR